MNKYMYIEKIESDGAVFNDSSKKFKAKDLMLKRFADKFPIHGGLTIKQVEYLVLRQTEWVLLITKIFKDYNDKLILRTECTELKPDQQWHRKMELFLNETRKQFNELTLYHEKTV